jgi:hypothetical protein
MAGKLLTILAVAISLVIMVFTTRAVAEDIPRMTKEDLKLKLGNLDVIILDLRSRKQWHAAKFKIPRAVWEDSYGLAFWAKKYPKDKTLVLY